MQPKTQKPTTYIIYPWFEKIIHLNLGRCSWTRTFELLSALAYPLLYSRLLTFQAHFYDRCFFIKSNEVGDETEERKRQKGSNFLGNIDIYLKYLLILLFSKSYHIISPSPFLPACLSRYSTLLSLKFMADLLFNFCFIYMWLCIYISIPTYVNPNCSGYIVLLICIWQVNVDF